MMDDESSPIMIVESAAGRERFLSHHKLPDKNSQHRLSTTFAGDPRVYQCFLKRTLDGAIQARGSAKMRRSGSAGSCCPLLYKRKTVPHRIPRCSSFIYGG